MLPSCLTFTHFELSIHIRWPSGYLHVTGTSITWSSPPSLSPFRGLINVNGTTCLLLVETWNHPWGHTRSPVSHHVMARPPPEWSSNAPSSIHDGCHYPSPSHYNLFSGMLQKLTCLSPFSFAPSNPFFCTIKVICKYTRIWSCHCPDQNASMLPIALCMAHKDLHYLVPASFSRRPLSPLPGITMLQTLGGDSTHLAIRTVPDTE